MAGKQKSASSGKPSGGSTEAAEAVEVRDQVVKRKRMLKSTRAGLLLPCSRVLRSLRKGRYADHVQVGASVYCTAVLEYLVAEVLEMAGEACRENKKKRINPRHLCLAIRQDEELNGLCKEVTISQGGVIPKIHQVLLPKPSKRKRDSESYEDA